MDPRIAVLEAAVERLTGQVAGLNERLVALEARGGGLSRPLAQPAGEAPPELAIPDRLTFLRFVTLAGRSLMALGGAYLLRALTDAGSLAPAVGVGLGLLYAASWLALAERAGGAGRPRSAAFHGLTGVAIAFPLIWEATDRLRVCPPPLSAVLLICFVAAGLGIAGRRGVRLLAWATTPLALGVGVGLLFRVQAPLPFGIALLVLGAAVAWATYRRSWPALRWLGTLGVDGALALCLAIATRSEPPAWLAPTAVIALLLAGAALYLVMLARRTLRPGAAVGAFESVQLTVAVVGGVAGAARLSGAGALAVALGALAVALSVAFYFCAFHFGGPEPARRPVRLLYASLAALLALIGLRLLLPPLPGMLALGGLALMAAWLGAAAERRLLAAQAGLFLLVLATVSGLLHQAGDALFAAPAHDWARLSAPALLALGLVAVGWVLLHRRPVDEVDRWAAGGARLVATVLLMAGLGAVVCTLLAGPLAAAPGPAADRGVLAAVRTGVVGLAAVALALFGRFSRGREAGWLVYPALIVGGLRFLTEDVPHGRASTLFVSFVLLGGALLVVSRLSGGGAPVGTRPNRPPAG